MNIHCIREACCSQDDQLGPLDQTFALRDDSSLGAFVAAVMASHFLQFSSSHTTMRCSMAGREVATVFSPYMEPPRDAVFALPPDTPLAGIAGDAPAEFVFVWPAKATAL